MSVVFDTVPNPGELVEATLAWCNEERQARGKEPLAELPPGIPGDPASCPCGAATGLIVSNDTYWDPADGYRVTPGGSILAPDGAMVWRSPSTMGEPLPPAVVRFVHLFDNGGLPDLVAEEYADE